MKLKSAAANKTVHVTITAADDLELELQFQEAKQAVMNELYKPGVRAVKAIMHFLGSDHTETITLRR